LGLLASALVSDAAADTLAEVCDALTCATHAPARVHGLASTALRNDHDTKAKERCGEAQIDAACDPSGLPMD
jgi:hypothetical protein